MYPRYPSRHPVMRRCTVEGKPGICYWRESLYWLWCSIDGELTVSGERRCDLWHPTQVVLGERMT